MHLSDFLNETFQESLYSFSPSSSTKKDDITSEHITISLRKTGEEVGGIHIEKTSHQLLASVYPLNNIPEEKKCTIFPEIKTSMETWFFTTSVHRIRLLQQTHTSKVSILPFDHRLFYMAITDLDLSMRAHTCLTREGYTTVGQISLLTKNQLSAIYQLGERSRLEIIQKLEMLGITIS